MTHNDEIGAIKIALRARLPDLLAQLGITDRPRRGMVTPRNPRRADAKGGSFVIWTKPERAGNWKDFATGDKGDVFGLIQYLRGCDKKEAFRFARDFTGIGEGLSEPERRRLAREAAALRAEAEAKAEAEARKRRQRAARIWLEASPEILGTPVETYANSRGIDLRKLRLEQGAHRFHPNFEYWRGKEKGQRGPTFPTLLTALRDENGAGRVLHFTFLAPDGKGKAPVERAKMIWPETSGMSLSMRIAVGESGLPAELAPPKSEVLAYAEGVEDVWTIAQADPELRAWAAGSLSGLLCAPIPLSAAAILVAADNDWGKPQVQQQLDRAVQRFAAARPTEIMRAAKGKDFNDQLMAEKGSAP